MVCVYCGSPTSVVNSRPKRRTNDIWRRRTCDHCGSTFTTVEQIDLQSALRVEHTSHHLQPFDRDRLFIDIYESCKHRPQAVGEAANLTQQVITMLLNDTTRPGLLDRREIIQTTHKTLKKFDAAAAVFYITYHPLD